MTVNSGKFLIRSLAGTFFKKDGPSDLTGFTPDMREAKTFDFPAEANAALSGIHPEFSVESEQLEYKIVFWDGYRAWPVGEPI